MPPGSLAYDGAEDAGAGLQLGGEVLLLALTVFRCLRGAVAGEHLAGLAVSDDPATPRVIGGVGLRCYGAGVALRRWGGEHGWSGLA